MKRNLWVMSAALLGLSALSAPVAAGITINGPSLDGRAEVADDQPPVGGKPTEEVRAMTANGPSLDGRAVMLPTGGGLPVAMDALRAPATEERR